tara:strand:+ start:286 stop:432 length:147 start_codon:yes stop_codon:yes gene_type:complete
VVARQHPASYIYGVKELAMSESSAPASESDKKGLANPAEFRNPFEKYR